MPHATDLDLTPREVAELASPDCIAAFFAKLGYDTARRTTLSPEAIGLAGETANAIKRIETLSEDPEQFLRVVFAQSKSLTAKVRNDLVRVLGRGTLDHLLVLASDFDTLEFVFLDKRKREQRGPAGGERIQVVPKTISVNRRDPSRLELRTLRRFTWTGRDALEQFDKLRSVFDAAAYTGEYFQNRGLFSDHFLRERVREDPVWRESPSELFAFVRELLRGAQGRWASKDKETVRNELLQPLFNKLGFDATVNRPNKTEQTAPDYLLKGSDGGTLTAAFVYAWDRWLDGPDLSDADTPDENPGACVVTALDAGTADWIIVTNGRLWRLYSRQAHARATNFYEVDLVEALTDSGDTDPNEAFRYWSLFFRPDAFRPCGAGVLPAAGTAIPQTHAAGTATLQGCWLDGILLGSREYAKRLGERLKDRIFVTIFPRLAQGFLADRKQRLGQNNDPNDEELADIFEATLTLLYRLLFLLYAESRDLLPIREAPYHEASLKKIKEEVAEAAGVAESEVDSRLKKAYSPADTGLCDRLSRLFVAMDRGDATLNVPTYNGGLFMAAPLPTGEGRGEGAPRPRGEETREQRIARFLVTHKVPDRPLALAIDLLARDQDERTFGLVFIDYKSLEVRHLGSIYEGLLEFKLKVAKDDLTTRVDKKGEKYIPLSQTKASGPPPARRRKPANVVVQKGDVYLSNDKSQRKASGSYYTPDPIVKYIIEQAVGPVLEEKLEALRIEFRKVRKTFDNELQKSKAYPSQEVKSGQTDHREWATLKTYNLHKTLVESLFEFRALDPAMGSGHFLVEAVDFITDRLLNFLNHFPINPVTFMLARTRRNILEALSQQGVSIDPDKLTDVNLLKRHVLKRCIYGVDLNPMAVELAKLSLWLDAFTLGAPLSFLDHHLRSGNSLIGATWNDLLDATAQRLFPINFERLVEAVRQVLEINRSPDATVSEVKRSESAYAEARAKLSGFRVVFDILTAKYFGFPDAVELLQHGQELELADRATFIHSVGNLRDRADVEKIERLAAAPDLHFFHWEVEFPEAFFSFIDVNQRHIRHKNEIAEGSAGFDAVIGNPPYVRMELIKPIKSFLKPRFRCHAERADLFIYFFEQALHLLRRGGRSAFIASSTWTRTNAGERLRALLKSEATVETFLDFGDLPVFPEATTYPAVMVIKRGAPPPSHEIVSAVVPELDNGDLSQLLIRRGVHVPQASLETTGWYLEDRRMAALRDKIRNVGVPLREYAGSPLRGIVSGLNEAFVVDALTCARLIAEDPKSEEILKRFLEGKDLKPWRYEWRGLWLIYTHHGVNIDLYPAIKAYLSTYRTRLEERATSDNHAWYELQQPQANYAALMEKPKILYPDITIEPRFVYDDQRFYFGNTTYFIPGADRYLQGVLNSMTAWWYLANSVRLMRGGYLRLFTQYVAEQRVPKAADADRLAIANLAEELSHGGSASRRELELELDDRVARLYGLTDDEKRLVKSSAPVAVLPSPPKD